MDTEDACDPVQAADAGVCRPVLDVLVAGAGQAGRQEDRFLGAVLPEPCDADAVADGEAFLAEPVVVIGDGGHPVNAVPKIIIGQPGKPGLL